MSDKRDALLAALSACIEGVPEAARHKLFDAIKAFEAEHTERKTSLSRFMAHLIPAAPTPPSKTKASKAKGAATKKKAKAKRVPAKENKS